MRMPAAKITEVNQFTPRACAEAKPEERNARQVDSPVIAGWRDRSKRLRPFAVAPLFFERNF